MKKAISVAVASVLLFFLWASPAQAEHSSNPNTKELSHVETSYDDTECGQASITLTVPPGTPADWVYRLQVEVNGTIVKQTELVKGPGTDTIDLTFEEDEFDGSVSVSYYFLDATEWDIVDESMNYSSTYPSVEEAFIAFGVNTDCVTPAPDPTDTASPSPSVNPTPTAEPSATPEPTEEPVPVSKQLPQTGNNTLIMLLLIAAGLGVSGTALLLVTRRRRVTS